MAADFTVQGSSSDSYPLRCVPSEQCHPLPPARPGLVVRCRPRLPWALRSLTPCMPDHRRFDATCDRHAAARSPLSKSGGSAQIRRNVARDRAQLRGIKRQELEELSALPNLRGRIGDVDSEEHPVDADLSDPPDCAVARRERAAGGGCGVAAAEQLTIQRRDGALLGKREPARVTENAGYEYNGGAPRGEQDRRRRHTTRHSVYRPAPQPTSKAATKSTRNPPTTTT